MLVLSAGDGYALFLNPKFQPLTAAAGLVLCLSGLALLRSPPAQPDVSRTLAFAALVSVVLLTGTGGYLKRPQAFSVKPPPETHAPDPHLRRDGRPYLKMNPARMAMLLMNGGPEAVDQAVVTRGVVKRSPELDRQGRFALLRVNMVCCLADAMAMGVVVASEAAGRLLDGEWVVVFGAVGALAAPARLADIGSIDEVPYTVVYDRAVLTASKVETIRRPRLPYVFELPSAGSRPARLTGEDDDY
jgi:hypothetical protein